MSTQCGFNHLTMRVKHRQPPPLPISKPSSLSSSSSSSSSSPSTSSDVHSPSMSLSSLILSLLSLTHCCFYSQPRKASLLSPSSSSLSSSYLKSSSLLRSSQWCCSAIVVMVLVLSAQVLQVRALDPAAREERGRAVGGVDMAARRDKLAAVDKKIDSAYKVPVPAKDTGKIEGVKAHEKLARNPKVQPFHGGRKDSLLKQLEEHEEKHNLQQKEMHEREVQQQQRQQQVLEDQQKQQQLLRERMKEEKERKNLIQDQKEREKEQKWLVDMQRKAAAEKSRQMKVANDGQQLPENNLNIKVKPAVLSNKKLEASLDLTSQKKAVARDINSLNSNTKNDNNNNVNIFDVKKQVADKKDEQRRLAANKASSSEYAGEAKVAGVKQPLAVGDSFNNNGKPATAPAVDNMEFPRLNNRRQGKINRQDDNNDNFNDVNNNINNNNDDNDVNGNDVNNNRPYQVNNDNEANRNNIFNNNNARNNLNGDSSYNDNNRMNNNNNDKNNDFFNNNNNNVHVDTPSMGGININWDWEDFSIMFNNYGGAEMKVRRAPHPTTGEPWPLPQYYSKKENKVYKISKDLRFVPTGHTCDILDEAMVRHLQRVLRGSVEDMYDNLQNAEGSNIDDPSLRYEKEEFVKAQTINRVEIRLRKACTKYPSLESDESYDLVVKKKKTFIYANEIWGILRGLETLGHLVWRGTDGILYIKESVISDYPRFPHRGLHIDTSRHFLFKEVLLDIMDSMEMNKFNVFHWHIVDDQSFPYESKVYPELSRKGAFHPSYVYSLEDIAELVEYARMRGIRVLPEFDTPGHTYAWGLSRPELLTQCFSGNTPVKGYLGPIDPSKNSTYRFLSTLFQEVMDVFKDQFLHLGGDEVPLGCWQSNPEVMAFANELNRKYQETMAKQPSLTQAQQQQQQNYNNYGGSWSMWSDEIKRVYEYYENRLIKLLGEIGRKRKNGVRYIMWQEVMNNNLQLPNDTIIQVWMGDMGDVMRATSLGYNVLYSTCWYLDHIEYGTKWPKYYHCDPVDQSYGYHIDEKKVLGGEAAFWSEYFTNENLLPMMWPRASAIAERLWSNKEVKNLEKAATRLSEHRCRMIKRGISAGEISGPGYCLHSPPKRRLFNDTIGCKGGNCSRLHNFVEIEDIQVHVSQRGGGLSECGNVLSRGDTGIMVLLILTFVLILFMITLTRSSSRFGRIRHCKNRSILLVFVLLLLVYFLCYTTIGLRAFEFSGSIHKTFQEDKRGQSKDGLPSLDGFQDQKRLLS